MKRLAFLSVVACLCGCALPGTGRAEFIIMVTEQGNNVVESGSGSLNLAALSFLGNYSETPNLNPNAGVGRVGATPPAGSFGTSFDAYYGSTVTTWGAFGTDVTTPNANSGSGGLVGLDAGQLVDVPTGYQSGTQFSASSTFDNTTIALLDLTPGTYTASWGSVSAGTYDDIKLEIIPGETSAAPEPSGLVLVGTAIGVVGFCRRIRRRRAWAGRRVTVP
jgi:hypothetical protein